MKSMDWCFERNFGFVYDSQDSSFNDSKSTIYTKEGLCGRDGADKMISWLIFKKHIEISKTT